MGNHQLLKTVTLLFAVFLLAVLAWLTWPESDDPCASSRADIGAAVLAEEGDQEGLVNRAIIVKGECQEEDQ